MKQRETCKHSYLAAIQLMDDDLREQVHTELARRVASGVAGATN